MIRRMAWAAAVVWLMAVGPAFATCGKVTACDTASTPLSPNDLIYVIQAGLSKKATLGNLSAIIGTGLTQGGALFAGPLGTISQDIGRFSWDATNHRLLIQGPGPIPSSPNGYGGNTSFIGNTSETPTSNWLETAINFTASDAKFAALSNTGGYGVVGGSRSSDSIVPSGFSYGVGGFALSNHSSATHTAAAFFGQTRATGPGNALGLEANIVNNGGASAQLTPYTLPSVSTQASIGLWASSGDPSVPGGTDASVGLGVINNTTAFKSGIVIGATALTGCFGLDSDAAACEAISLGRLQRIGFWNSGNTTTPTSGIFSSTTSGTTHTQNIVFGNTGVFINDVITGAPVVSFATGAAGNCAAGFSNATAGQTAVSYAGTATNCNAVFNTQGASSSYGFFVNGSGTAELAMNSTGVFLPTVLSCSTALITDGSGKISCHP